MSKLSPRVLASYSGVTIPMAAMGMPIAVYLPPFYSDGLGLSLLTVGTVFTIARIWDVITDPLMGLIVDRSTHPGAGASTGSRCPSRSCWCRSGRCS